VRSSGGGTLKVESAGASVKKMGVLTFCACGNRSKQSDKLLAIFERDGRIQDGFVELCEDKKLDAAW
jgi:hypothetical protein